MKARMMTELRPCSLDFPTLIMREIDTGRAFVTETTRVLDEKILSHETFFTYDEREGGRPVLHTIQCVEKTLEIEVFDLFQE